MSLPRYYTVKDGALHIDTKPPSGAVPLTHHPERLLPPVVTGLHRGFRTWGDMGLSPGQMRPERVWFSGNGILTIRFKVDYDPVSVMQVGPGPDVAAWLVLLDQWMETFVVIARARTVWSVAELASAMTFLSPIFLPTRLLAFAPDSWEQVAQALALAIADGPLKGEPSNLYWQERM